VSFDGAQSWAQGSFVGLTRPRAIVPTFSGDGLVVWIWAHEGYTAEDPLPYPPFRLYRSIDGGLNFSLAPGWSDSWLGYDKPIAHTFINPYDSNTLYFSRSHYMDESNYLYRYRVDRGELTQMSLPFNDGQVFQMAFHPIDPKIIYTAHTLEGRPD
jgi:hypothetical protein